MGTEERLAPPASTPTRWGIDLDLPAHLDALRVRSGDEPGRHDARHRPVFLVEPGESDDAAFDGLHSEVVEFAYEGGEHLVVGDDDGFGLERVGAGRGLGQGLAGVRGGHALRSQEDEYREPGGSSPPTGGGPGVHAGKIELRYDPGVTPIDPTLIETLLNMSEGATLDFKRDQYRFSGATEEQKGELVKDVIAFANAWKTTDAYIVIGADENPGGRATVVGVTSHLDDADVQQLVNSKTNRPVHFEYVPVTFDGLQLGVLRVKAEQQRPIFLAKPFGKLKPDVVYARRGSSTAVADPDEIARMGASAVSMAQEPVVTIELGDPEERMRLGTSALLRSTILRDPPSLPDILGGSAKLRAMMLSSRTLFGPDRKALARHKRDLALLNRVGFRAENVGGVLVEDARIVLAIPRSEHLRVVDEIPDEPRGPHNLVLMVGSVRGKRYTQVTEIGDVWEVLAVIGKVQPQATVWSLPFWIGSAEPCDLPVVARLYGDNVGRAVEVPFNIRIDLTEGLLDRSLIEDDP